MTRLRTFVPFRVVVEEAKCNLICSFALVLVMSFCIYHFSEGTSCMPRYVYG
jgi:hypothetical protein